MAPQECIFLTSKENIEIIEVSGHSCRKCAYSIFVCFEVSGLAVAAETTAETFLVLTETGERVYGCFCGEGGSNSVCVVPVNKTNSVRLS